jgi:hypothetical protein
MSAGGVRMKVRLLSMVAVMALLGGCGSGGVPPPPTPSSPGTSSGPDAAAIAVLTPTASPAPSASLQSAEDRLHRALSAGAPWQATATLEGTIGGVEGTLSGTLAVRGNDLDLKLVTTIGGNQTTVRQVVAGGSSYVKFEDQTWQLVPQDASHPRPSSFRTALMTVGCSESPAGTLVIREDGADAIARALGMADPGSAEIGAEATMTLRPDGNPHRLRLGLDGVAGRWDVEYAFDSSATVEPITAPAGAVSLWHSDVFLLLYPVDWEVHSIGKAPEILDLFSSANGVVTVWCEPTKFSLAAWTADGVRAYSEDWSARPTGSWTGEYGANTWSVTDWAEATAYGDPGTAMAAATVHGGMGCDVTVFVPSFGDREALLGEFGRLLVSFNFLN